MFKAHFSLGVCTLAAAMSTLQATPANRLAAASLQGDELVCHYTFADPVIVSTDAGDRVQVADAEVVSSPGAPLLPHYAARILIPAGRSVLDVSVEPLNTRQLAGVLRIPPAAIPVPLSRPNLLQPLRPNSAIYGSDDLVPATAGGQIATLTKHGRSIVLVRLNPIQYRPQSGRAWFTPDFTVTVTLQPLSARMAVVVRTALARSQPGDRDDLALSVDNAGQLDIPAQAATSSATTLAAAPLSSVLPPGKVDYLIVTDANLLAAPPPFNFAALCAARRAQGLNATNVTLDWITANYSGLRPDGTTDTPTRIRNFIADAYATWGVRYLLLGGNVDHVPARQCYVDSKAGYVTTMPVDLYYGCLDGTYDGNRNGIYGEPDDGESGGDVDLSAEVYVGRLSVANAQELANAVRKLLAYEAQPVAALTNICMVGEYLGFGGISEYATATMEQIRLGGTYDGYNSVGFGNSQWSNLWATGRNLYDSPTSSWSGTDLIRMANASATHVFNHLGHANHSYNMKLNTGSLSGFTNANPFFAYSQGCDAGAFDSANCFAEVLTTMDAGAFAIIMNARYGWGDSNTTDGPSQRFNRTFWDAAFDANTSQLGRMNQLSKEHWLANINSECMRWCYYEITLFGDPATPFARPIVGASPAQVIVVGAAQTTSNLQSGITVSNYVSGIDGKTGGLEMLFSTNCGSSWGALPILQASATIGSLVISNGAPLPIEAVSSGGPGVTNTVTVRLSATNALPLTFCTNTLVRVRFWDGINWSHSVTGKPFLVDNEPPSSSLATVKVSRSAFGNYIVGPALTAVWSNFTDRGSGIAGYYLSGTNGEGAPYGQWCTDSTGCVNTLTLNATNTIYVWARDLMGNCGTAVSAKVLVLDPGGDADGDGLVNSEEEIAGTDARNSAQSFRFTATGHSVLAAETGATYKLTWDSTIGRLYSLKAASDLHSANWDTLTTNMPGTGGTLSYTDRMNNAVRRFYRLHVTAP